MDFSTIEFLRNMTNTDILFSDSIYFMDMLWESFKNDKSQQVYRADFAMQLFVCLITKFEKTVLMVANSKTKLPLANKRAVNLDDVPEQTIPMLNNTITPQDMLSNGTNTSGNDASSEASDHVSLKRYFIFFKQDPKLNCKLMLWYCK